MADEQLSRRSLLALLGGAGGALLGRHGDALAAALGEGGARRRAGGAAARVAQIGAGAEAAGGGAEAAGGGEAALAAEGGGVSGPLPLAQPVLDAGPGQPPIVARRAWAGSDCPPVRAPQYGTVQMAFVHHTDNPNGYSPAQVPAMLRAIYAYHRYGRRWNDIGYNFVIDRFGRIFEARAGGIDQPVVGAQAGGYNGFSTGIAMLGDYEFARLPSAARESLQRLIAWKLSLHGAPVEGRLLVHVESGEGAAYSRFPAGDAVELDRVCGHRQADATSCPGGALFGQLPQVRRVASRLAGRPAVLTLAISTTPPDAESGEALVPANGAVPRLLTGALRHLDGSPIAQAPVEVQVARLAEQGQSVGERTIAIRGTDAEGAFALALALTPDPGHESKTTRSAGERRGRPGAKNAPPASPRPIAYLRALCRGAEGVPATVSAPLAIDARVVQVAAAPVS